MKTTTLLAAAVVIGFLALAVGVAAVAHTLATAEPPGTHTCHR